MMIGIDLGTTNSLIAYWDDNTQRPRASQTPNSQTPNSQTPNSQAPASQQTALEQNALEQNALEQKFLTPPIPSEHSEPATLFTLAQGAVSG
jgi:molecular chaperone DnaK (HSP70)